jgi:hypothetical protein
MRKAVVLGIAIVVGALAPASAVGKPKPKKKVLPDLRITKVVVDEWENFAYQVVNTDGQMTHFTVRVTIRNDGKKKAPASVTLVFFRDSRGREFKKSVDFRALLPGKGRTVKVTMTADKPALGFAKLGAMADWPEKIEETSENDNFGPPADDPFTNHHRGIKFAVIAREWHPADFETDANGFPAKIRTYSAGLRFVFSSADKDGYTYLPWGGISNSATATGICSGSDLETRGHNPWPKGELRINSELNGYVGEVLPGPTEQYSITVTCFGAGSHTESHQFLALQTFAGQSGEVELPMATNATRLNGMYTDSRVMTTWIWDLHAAVG